MLIGGTFVVLLVPFDPPVDECTPHKSSLTLVIHQKRINTVEFLGFFSKFLGNSGDIHR